jgi:hypothetical protein
MAYRFSDTGKWADEWFVDLSPLEKLLFLYLCDNCDIAGFYELSLRKLNFDTGISPDEIKGALKGLERGYILSEDKRVLFLKKFVKHQKNLPLNPDNKAHRGIISRFENYSDRFEDDLIAFVNKGASMGLQSPTGNGIGNGIDTGTIKLFTKEVKFFKIFERWINYKKARKEMYKTQDSYETAFKKLLKYSAEDAVMANEIIDSAIGNNYSGFFELSQKDLAKIQAPKQQISTTRKIDHRNQPQ